MSAFAAGGAAALNVALTGRLSLFFDLTFVVICLAAALAVHPRELFVVGVMPPLLMFLVVLVLAILARGAVAEPVDSVVQAIVSGLAHHAGGLIGGYLSALTILALRQVSSRGSSRAVDRTRSFA